MRILLEWLGLVESPRGRREPVALPTWAPIAVAFAGTALIYLSSLAIRTLFI